MSSETIIKVHNVSKCYQIYDQPNDRLKQGLFSLAARLCPITTLKQSLLQKAHACSRQYWALHDVSFELKKAVLSASSDATVQAKVPCCRYCAGP
jgi:lipopolysaccharide transport system ATP-binding protein